MPLPLRAIPGGAPVESADDLRDKEAVERCLSGERDAFAVLVQRHGKALYGFSARMVGPALAEEIAQESFARAWTGLASFRSDARVKHWLYRIALNLCRDHLKSGRARETSVGAFEGPLEPVDAKAGPEDHAVGRQEWAALARALDKLTPKYREAFVLKHLENLSYEEMRDIVKMPVPALKVRVHRAREMLRKLLEEGAR